MRKTYPLAALAGTAAYFYQLLPVILKAATMVAIKTW